MCSTHETEESVEGIMNFSYVDNLLKEPIIPGETHPIELLILDAEDLDWIASYYSQATSENKRSLLLALGRLPKSKISKSLKDLLKSGLSDPDLGVREAVIRSAESLGDPSIIHSHFEQVPWLRKYLEGVLVDLQKAHRERSCCLTSTASTISSSSTSSSTVGSKDGS